MAALWEHQPAYPSLIPLSVGSLCTPEDRQDKPQSAGLGRVRGEQLRRGNGTPVGSVAIESARLTPGMVERAHATSALRKLLFFSASPETPWPDRRP